MYNKFANYFCENWNFEEILTKDPSSAWGCDTSGNIPPCGVALRRTCRCNEFHHVKKRKSSSPVRCYVLRRQNQNTHFLFSKVFFFENRSVYETMWENNVQLNRPQMTIWRMRIACRIHKATNTHSEYVTLIVFPLQQWLHERVSLLRYTYSTLAGLPWITANNMQRFLDLFISINCSNMFQTVPPPIIRSTKLYMQRQILSNQYCCYRGWDGTASEFHLIHDSSRQQYWFDNTWRCMYSFVLLMMGGGTVWNMLEQFIETNRPRKSCMLLAVIQRYTCDARRWRTSSGSLTS